MARSSGNSLLNSLRGKIWISTSVLAFFICTFGLISYLIVTLLTSNPFYGVFIPFLFLAFSVIVFGWWLSNELVGPIEKVILLSKSLERNSSTSIPKTSGSTETDQLLQTLHRNSMQMQNVVSLMDKVAGGDIDVALTPLKGSDRLTASFQKLLSKVSESIHAKEDLTKLEREIEQVKREISGVRTGNLDVEINSDNFKTKEITETFKYLIENLSLLISLIKVDSFQAQQSANQVKTTIGTLIEQDENTIQKMNQASITLKQVPNLIEKISEDLMRSAKSAKQTIDKTRHGTKISQENSESVSQLRSKLREAVSRMQNLNERSQEIAKVAKTVEDLANRTNMIALNASIQATDFGGDGRGFVLVSEELERLAARANGTNKQISTLNNSIISEIGKVEDSLDKTSSEIAGLSKFAIETTNVLGELERYVGQFLSLQENLIAFSKDKSEETDKAFNTFVSTISESERTIKDLEDSSSKVKNISLMMKNLQDHAAGFRLVPPAEPEDSKPTPDEYISTPEENPEQGSNETEQEVEQTAQDFTTKDFNDAKLDTADIDAMNEASMKPLENNSSEFNSEEFDWNEFDSRDFDSGELYAEEMKALTDTLDETPREEFISKDLAPEENISESINSEEFETDDIEINEQQLNQNVLEVSDSESDTKKEQLEDAGDDDLLNLVNDHAPEPDINLSA